MAFSAIPRPTNLRAIALPLRRKSPDLNDPLGPFAAGCVLCTDAMIHPAVGRPAGNGWVQCIRPTWVGSRGCRGPTPTDSKNGTSLGWLFSTSD